jgi:hypothetical protein
MMGGGKMENALFLARIVVIKILLSMKLAAILKTFSVLSSLQLFE